MWGVPQVDPFVSTLNLHFMISNLDKVVEYIEEKGQINGSNIVFLARHLAFFPFPRYLQTEEEVKWWVAEINTLYSDPQGEY